MDNDIPFNKPYMTGKELSNMAEAHFNSRLAGDGPFTTRCHKWLEHNTATLNALLTHSCTAALEMSALLLDVQPGDEVIMPSYTFVSTANAFVLRGAKPVFVDVREDTLNLDENKIEAAITSKTKAIVPVHYAGVGCEMDTIIELASCFSLAVVEDAAQGVMARYKGRALGSIGCIGTYSFHETKNIISGEGGAILINDAQYVEQAEIIREKGTDRSRFFRGEVDKYTWQEAGSSFLPGELIAAFLWAQMEEAENITLNRLQSWNYYHKLLAPMEQRGLLRRQFIPEYCEHNAHMYYIILAEHIDRNVIINALKAAQIHSVFHYVPLHNSPAGKKYSRISGKLHVTEDLSARLVRLPIWMNITDDEQGRVVEILEGAIIQYEK